MRSPGKGVRNIHEGVPRGTLLIHPKDTEYFAASWWHLQAIGQIVDFEDAPLCPIVWRPAGTSRPIQVGVPSLRRVNCSDLPSRWACLKCPPLYGVSPVRPNRRTLEVI